MTTRSPWATAISSAFLGLFGSIAFAEGISPSRKPNEGCAWKRLSDRTVGLELFAQECDLGFRKIHFEMSPKDASVYEVMIDTAPGAKPSREQLIIVYKKAPAERIEAAIKRVAAPLAPAPRRALCRAVPAKDTDLGPGRKAYQYAPVDEDKLVEAAGGDIPDLPCGEYGLDFDSQSYFEYHPAENPKRFALVFIGQDEPLFDEKSLTFLP